MFHLIDKKAYKVELPKRWKIHDVFHVLLLEQNTTRKRRVNKKVFQLEIETSNSNKYKMEAIQNSVINNNKIEGHIPGLYYLLAWKRYIEKENTWEPSLVV